MMGELLESICVEKYINDAIEKYGKLFTVIRQIPCRNSDMFGDTLEYVNNDTCEVRLYFVTPHDAINSMLVYGYSQSDIIISDTDGVEGLPPYIVNNICTPIKFWSNRSKRYIPIAINDSIYTWIVHNVEYNLLYKHLFEMNDLMTSTKIDLFKNINKLMVDLDLYSDTITSMLDGDSGALISRCDSDMRPYYAKIESDYDADTNNDILKLSSDSYSSEDDYEEYDEDEEVFKSFEEIEEYISDYNTSKYNDDNTICIGHNECSFEGISNMIRQGILGKYEG